MARRLIVLNLAFGIACASGFTDFARSDAIMNRCRFNLCLTAEQYLKYYKYHASQVIAQSDDGIRLAFPASELRRYVTRQGVHGRFEIVFDSSYRLVSLTRLY